MHIATGLRAVSLKYLFWSDLAGRPGGDGLGITQWTSVGALRVCDHRCLGVVYYSFRARISARLEKTTFSRSHQLGLRGVI